jgi:hypothetical protein
VGQASWPVAAINVKARSQKTEHDELRAEYDLAKLGPGVRGKYYQQATVGPGVFPIDPDVEEVNPAVDAENRPNAGQWVAIEGDQLVSHGENANAVLQQARAEGVPHPLVMHIPKEPPLPFGGW